MEQAVTVRKKGLSGNALKMIAIITMMIDHIGAAVIENGILRLPELTSFDVIMQSERLMFWWQTDMILRMIGRIAFPIFCFLMVEGFVHTRDVKKYGLRLLAFCFISEIPFDLAFWNSWFEPQHQNVYFTLFLGLIAMIGVKRYRESIWKQMLIVLVCAGSATFLKTDYGSFGVFLIVLLYWLRGNKKMQTILGAISVAWELTAPLAFIPLWMYNGERGKWNVKYLFYVFYPAHILLLWGIRMLFF